jgi:hypothetical protein
MDPSDGALGLPHARARLRDGILNQLHRNLLPRKQERIQTILHIFSGLYITSVEKLATAANHS